MGHVVLPRVFRTAADTADIYGGVPDALFAPLFDVADKADIYGGMPDCLLWQAYDAFVASLRTVRGRAHPAASPRPRRRPAATLRPRVQRARRAARSRRPARFCPEAEAARPQLKPTRRPGRADVPALRPRTATAAALEAARAGTPVPGGDAARDLGRGAAAWRAMVAGRPPALRELAAAYGAADAGAGGDARAEARLARAVSLARAVR